MKTDFYPRLAGVLWALSFFFGFAYLPVTELERLGCVLTGFAGLGVLLAAGGPLREREVPVPLLALLVAGFALLAVASAAWSAAPYYSVLYLGGFLLLPATILAVLAAAPQNRTIFLCWAGGGAGIVVACTALWALIQIFCLPETLVNGQPRNPFPNPNAFAGLLGLSFFAGLGLFFQSGQPKTRLLYWVFLAVILSAFAGIAGKAASLALAVGLFGLVAFGDRTAIKARWKPLLSLGGAVLAAATAMRFLSHQRGAIDRVYGMLMNGETATIANRIDIWQATLKLIAENPFFGTGYASFALTYPSVRPIADYYSSGLRAHMDPLQFWAELGVLGPVLFYAIGFTVLARFITFRKREKAQGKVPDMVALALFLGCGAFLAHSHVDFLFYVTPTLMAFGLAVAALVLRIGREADSKTVFHWMKDTPPALQGLPVMLPWLLFLLVFIPVMGGEYYAGRASRALKDGDLNAYAAAVNTGNKIGLGLNARPYLMAAMVPMDILTAAPYTRLEQQQALFRQIDGLLECALRRNRMLASAWYQRGVMLRHLNPDIVPEGYWTAEESFQAALRIDPQHLPARLGLAELYAGEGREEAEFALLMDGVERPYPLYDAAPFYERVRALALRLGQDEALPVIDRYARTHDDRVEAARRYESAVKAALGADGNEIFLIP